MDDTYEISVPIQPDEEGMAGKECPKPDCEKYFKVKGGTGIPDNQDMYCPYCSSKGSSNEFFTKEQIEYAKSIALRQLTGMFGKELKKLERHSFKNALLSLNIRIESKPYPIKYYVEKQLQENISCEDCGCEYAIYGIYAICPDCGQHNLFQIFQKNVCIIRRQLELEDKLYEKFGETNRKDIDDLTKDLGDKFLEDAYKNVVTAFETFCREVYNKLKHKAINPSMVLKGNPFQSLDRTKDIFFSQHKINIFANLSNDEIERLSILFNKRHILTHNLGIIDQKFLSNTELQQGFLNHKVETSKQEVTSTLTILTKVAEYVKGQLF